MRPMLATPTAAVPTGDAWVHEIKWDGWRVITHIEDGRVRLLSRSGRDITSTAPELGGLVLPDLILDGELVAFDEAGIPTLGALASSHPTRIGGAGGRRARIAMMLFDILAFEGTAVVDQPWEIRRGLLESLADHLGHDRWLIPDTYDDGAFLLDHTRDVGLEGVVSKRRDSPYRPGVRSEDWRKRPHRTRRSVVVGGWRPETGSRGRLGALLVGTPDGTGALHYLGRVGSGLGGATGDEVASLLAELPTATCPFDEVPPVDATGTTWVAPELVVDVESLGLSTHGRLRQPAVIAARHDLTPADLPRSPASPGDTDA